MMPYQTILVHTERSAGSRSRLGVGISLAREFAARFVGVYVDDASELTPFGAALLPSDTVDRFLRNAVEAQRVAEDAFRQAAAAAGVTNVDYSDMHPPGCRSTPPWPTPAAPT